MYAAVCSSMCAETLSDFAWFNVRSSRWSMHSEACPTCKDGTVWSTHRIYYIPPSIRLSGSIARTRLFNGQD